MNEILTGLPARIVVLCLGIALLPFYGILFIAAWVHLPASWIGVLYAGYGLAAGICGFAYFFRKKRVLLYVMLPALILTALTWSGIQP